MYLVATIRKCLEGGVTGTYIPGCDLQHMTTIFGAARSNATRVAGQRSKAIYYKGVDCTATELISGGASLPTIRKRLSHKHAQTTLRAAEQSDGTAEVEVRA